MEETQYCYKIINCDVRFVCLDRLDRNTAAVIRSRDFKCSDVTDEVVSVEAELVTLAGFQNLHPDELDLHLTVLKHLLCGGQELPILHTHTHTHQYRSDQQKHGP